MLFKTLLFSLLIFSSVVVLNAQNTTEFNTKKSLCDSCERNISLQFESSAFVKNNEYNNNFTQGFTGIGTYLKPTVEYYLTNTTKVNLGGYFLKYSGLNSFSQITPIFSVQQKLNNQFEIVLGSLYGALNHNVKEPLYRFDRYYQNNVEYGLQVLHDSKNVTSDLWVNWEKYIFNNDPFQEEFEAGSVSEFVFSKNKVSFNIPLQLLMVHKGGQIDTSPNPAISIFNGTSGLDLGYKINENSRLSLESLLYIYQGLDLPQTGVNSQLFNSGSAYSINLKYKNKVFNSSIGYWNANRFIAPKGEYLFMSVSENNPTFTQENRTLLTGKVNFVKTISESVKLSFRTDAYLDMQNSDFAFANGLYLIINENFFLKKVRKIK